MLKKILFVCFMVLYAGVIFVMITNAAMEGTGSAIIIAIVWGIIMLGLWQILGYGIELLKNDELVNDIEELS